MGTNGDRIEECAGHTIGAGYFLILAAAYVPLAGDHGRVTNCQRHESRFGHNLHG
ncbi:hypothetical protein Mp_2g17290 [Marchantia polymorpha subsp. ruderalis]|uniref:Uncharacterized protein n=1 Tax=Marchantia polymorpha TaxID=3197 RepID=A0A2R6VYR0_MARPO|nr:hypothetical protein MARPO_0578s0001 [Marchantia polymorpha]BBN02694.1 hypothetical protein Mp_2g17290 [Marchantia polymorpha subsp. ruderalis]|eukprot:PTQ26701.1 hypothetical protein MARPO_0578s0001 [Marchantia polymorpha]